MARCLGLGLLSVFNLFRGIPHLADYFDHIPVGGRVSRCLAARGLDTSWSLDQVRLVGRSSLHERCRRDGRLAANRTVDVLPHMAAQGELVASRSRRCIGFCGCGFTLVPKKLPRVP